MRLSILCLSALDCLHEYFHCFVCQLSCYVLCIYPGCLSVCLVSFVWTQSLCIAPCLPITTFACLSDVIYLSVHVPMQMQTWVNMSISLCVTMPACLQSSDTMLSTALLATQYTANDTHECQPLRCGCEHTSSQGRLVSMPAKRGYMSPAFMAWLCCLMPSASAKIRLCHSRA